MQVPGKETCIYQEEKENELLQLWAVLSLSVQKFLKNLY